MAEALSEAVLREALLGTQQIDTSMRRVAEAHVESLQAQPGFAFGLCRLMLDAAGPLALRQLAALILKNFVRAHWSFDGADEDVSLQGPAHAVVHVCAAEKAAVRRALLPAGLCVCHRAPTPGR